MDHLPECPMLHEQYPKHPLENCDYCNMLRACEQRVRDSILGNYRSSIVYDNGYEDGVQAARDAVADEAYTAPFGADDEAGWIDRQSALAAIDALRGE